MNKLLIYLLLFCCSSAFANEQWYVAQSKTNHTTLYSPIVRGAYVAYTAAGFIYLFIPAKDFECEDFTKILPVNDVNVRFRGVCLKDVMTLHALTKRGNTFIVNQFHSEATVKMGPWEISANNFNELVPKFHGAL